MAGRVLLIGSVLAVGLLLTAGLAVSALYGLSWFWRLMFGGGIGPDDFALH